MRYLAQRASTGEWLSRDLPLSGVERVRELSGPGSISFTVPADLRYAYHSDGLRVLDDWGTFIYAADEDTGVIRQGGIVVPPQEHEPDELRVTAAGFAAYPQGYIRSESLTSQIQVDPIAMFIEHWAWMQGQTDSNLGVQIVGSTASTVRIGSNEEPYRLEWFEAPDLGAAMDDLAANTPFDYVESHAMSGDDVLHRVRIGWPRLGRDRPDLAFRLGENITDVVTAGTSTDYANDIMGIGNGEASTLIHARATISDGRLRRTRVITDKTIKNPEVMGKWVRDALLRFSPTLDLSTVVIKDHPNAPISAIQLGDDVLIETHLPSYGDVRVKVRVLSIGEADEQPGLAVLGVQRSNAFVYNPEESVV